MWDEGTEQEEKEIIEGYEVKYSMPVGGKRFVYGIHTDPEKKEKYFEGVVTVNEIFKRCEGYASEDYFDVMRRLIDGMTAELDRLEKLRDDIDMENIACLGNFDVIPVSHNESIVGQVVAIREKYLNDGYKNISHQLFYVDGGHGAMGGARGNACFGWDLYRRERTRIERYEVLGIVRDEKMPEFAKKTLSMIKSGELKEEWERRNEKNDRTR